MGALRSGSSFSPKMLKKDDEKAKTTAPNWEKDNEKGEKTAAPSSKKDYEKGPNRLMKISTS